MARNTRDTVLLAKIEGTYGSDSSPTGSANAILISRPNLTPLKANNVDRALVRPYFGSSEQLVGTRNMSCSFVAEINGSGTAGTAPAIGPLLRACALAETITAATRVDYTPITNGQESSTLIWADSGVLHQMLGVRGNVRGGTSSTTQVMPVSRRTLARISSRRRVRSSMSVVRHWTRTAGASSPFEVVIEKAAMSPALKPGSCSIAHSMSCGQWFLPLTMIMSLARPTM